MVKINNSKLLYYVNRLVSDANKHKQNQKIKIFIKNH